MLGGGSWAQERLPLVDACGKQSITIGGLIIHVDSGTSTTSKRLALMRADLGVTKTHSHPVSDDDPYSESHFKTLKYRPELPERFGSNEDARAFCQNFFARYNHVLHHSGIALLIPGTRHYDFAGEVCGTQSGSL